MKHRVDNKSHQRTDCPQALLTKMLAGVIHRVARQIHPSVFQDIVRGIGTEHGRLAASEWRLTHGVERRCDRRTSAQCLEAVGQQCGWNLQATVESADTLRVNVLECRFTEPREYGFYLCDLAAGLCAGVVAETLGYAKIYADQCPETPPLHCVFTIYLDESEDHLATPDIIHPHTEQGSVLVAEGSLESVQDQRLTPREVQVLRLIAQGLSDKKIAATLRLSVRTVENHTARIR
ncbi:helix-turn-helix transcriptional regulator [Candidatus Methylomirabilis sp.]|uniref:helix-turn-helix transcriptional regulator n=1 Tax=Candidatus Methylomirabilis sp. TaxID=2032687 RepID=UPI002A62977C|nr:helix-turn-helix transcriptional regulator [Candidatus Methylomirabilis sp.]